MNILVTTEYLLPDYGGAEKTLFAFLSELVNRKYKVFVVTTDYKNRQKNNENINGIKINNFSKYGRWGISPKLFFYLMGKNVFNIVYAQHYYSFTAFIAALFSNIYHIPLIVKPIGASPREISQQLSGSIGIIFEKTIGFFVLKSATIIVPTTTYEKLYLLKIGIKKDKIKVIPSGIRIDDFKNLPSSITFKKRYDVPEYFKILLYVGRIEIKKGLYDFIEAMPQILNKFPNTIAVFAGEGKHKKNLVEKAKKIGVKDHILFTGFLKGEYLLEAYAASDIFILPSHFELASLVIREANICMMPVIASNIGGNPEFIKNGLNGFLVEPKNPTSIAEKVCLLLSDDNLRRKMGENSFKYAINHSLSGYIFEKISVFNKIINSMM